LFGGGICQAIHGLSGQGASDYFAIGLIGSLTYVGRLRARGLYDFGSVSKPGVEMTEVIVSWAVAVLVLTFFAFLAEMSILFSRGSFLLFAGAAPVWLLVVRKLEKLLLARGIARGAIGRRNIVVVGDNAEMEAIGDREYLAFFGASEVTRFVLTDAEDPQLRQSSDVAMFSAVANFVRKHQTAEVLLAVPWRDAERIDFLREQVKTLSVVCRLLPDAQIRSLTNFVWSARQKVLSIEIQRPPLGATALAAKRAMDLVFGLAALIVAMPVMVLAALAIRLDGPGPILFRQHRKGFSGRRFAMLKFRTMRVQKDGQTGEALVHEADNNSRVTRVGSRLRAFGIDELPQLLNVLRGEMSLVGPRPHTLTHDNHFEKVLEDFAFRHHIKPGMTGWAQVYGWRDATTAVDPTVQRVKLDIWYINNRSLWLDLQIVMKALCTVLRRKPNAS